MAHITYDGRLGSGEGAQGPDEARHAMTKCRTARVGVSSRYAGPRGFCARLAIPAREPVRTMHLAASSPLKVAPAWQ